MLESRVKLLAAFVLVVSLVPACSSPPNTSGGPAGEKRAMEIADFYRCATVAFFYREHLDCFDEYLGGEPAAQGAAGQPRCGGRPAYGKRAGRSRCRERPACFTKETEAIRGRLRPS